MDIVPVILHGDNVFSGPSTTDIHLPARLVKLPSDLPWLTSCLFNALLGNGYIAKSEARKTTSRGTSNTGFPAADLITSTASLNKGI
jgi:hypothetical protein